MNRLRALAATSRVVSCPSVLIHRPLPSSSVFLRPSATPNPNLRSLPASRALHTSGPLRARYERFDSPYSSSPSPSPGGRGSGGGANDAAANFLSYLRRRVGGDRALWLYGLAFGGGGIYYVAHLERVPETGRLRFMNVSEASERELGYQTQLQTLKEYSRALLPPNHPTTKRVRTVAARIVESAGLGRVKSGGEMGAVEASVPDWSGNSGNPANGEVNLQEVLFGTGQGAKEVHEGKETEWEVYVIDDRKTKNAFVLPGGKIFVFTGILPVSGNDDGLATVLGHEIAHVVARHGAERMSSMTVLFGLGILLETLGLDVGFTRILLTFMYQLPNSRKSESEADYIGLRLMAKACFDPSESTKMWQRMSQADGAKGIGSIDFMSTHPANAKRIKSLESWLPEAQQIRGASECGQTSRYFGGFMDASGAGAGQGMGQTFWG